MSQPSAPSAAAPGWKFQRRHPVCSVCERPFEDGEVHFSVLSIQAGELIREDPCFRCWSARPGGSGSPADQAQAGPEAAENGVAQAADVQTADVQTEDVQTEDAPVEDAAPQVEQATGATARPEEVFWWRTRHQDQKKKGLALNLPALEALFVSLEGRSERAVRELRYLVCLILMRKRRVKLVRIRREKSGEAFEVRRPRRQESLQVWVFDFSPERIDELRSELVALFDAHEGSEEDEDQAQDGATEEAAGDEAAALDDETAAEADSAEKAD